MNLKAISVHELNKFIKDKAQMYTLIRQSLGLYLPEFRSKAITKEYLLDIAEDKIFSIKSTDVKIAYVPNTMSVESMFTEFMTVNTPKPIGLKKTNPPDKQWMANVIFTLKPNSIIFKQAEKPTSSEDQVKFEAKRTIIENIYTQSITDPSKKKRGFFNLTEEEQKEVAAIRVEKKEERKRKRIARLLEEVSELRAEENANEEVKSFNTELERISVTPMDVHQLRKL